MEPDTFAFRVTVSGGERCKALRATHPHLAHLGSRKPSTGKQMHACCQMLQYLAATQAKMVEGVEKERQ